MYYEKRIKRRRKIIINCFLVVFLLVGAFVTYNLMKDNENFHVTRSEIKMAIDGEYTIIVQDTKSVKSNSNFIYLSSDSDVVEVDKYGNITAKNTGEATITIKAKGSKKKVDMVVQVVNISINSLKFKEKEYQVNVGESLVVYPVINNDEDFVAKINYESTDENILKVTDDGEIIGVSEGYTILSATVNDTDVSSNVKVKVNPAVKKETKKENKKETKPTSPKTTNTKTDSTKINISLGSGSLTVGETTSFKYDVQPSKSANVTVSDNNVIKIESGNIIALKEGTAKITVATLDGKVKESVNVTVAKKVVHVSNVQISPTSTLVYVGSCYTFNAQVGPNDATNKNITWSLSNPALASISSDGKLCGVKSGVVYVYAKSVDGNITAKSTVTIRSIIREIRPEKTTYTLNPGQKVLFNYQITPGQVDNPSITWTSTNQNVARIQNGYIYADQPGTATITGRAVDGGVQSPKIIVNVGSPLKEIRPPQSSIKLKKGQTTTISLSRYPSNSYGNFTINNSNPNVAEITKDGKITAKNPGSTIIKFVVSGGATTSMQITVENITELSLKATNISVSTGQQISMPIIVNSSKYNISNLRYSVSPNTGIVSLSGYYIIARKPGSVKVVVSCPENDCNPVSFVVNVH